MNRVSGHYSDLLTDRTPHIDYPCWWQYKLIGSSEIDIRAAVVAVMADKEMQHELSSSNISRTGRYCSMLLEVLVPDEQVRRDLHGQLRSQAHIIMVL